MGMFVSLHQTREDDVNGDGLYDQLDFQLSMPLDNTEQVTAVQLMLFFHYILQVTLHHKSARFNFSARTEEITTLAACFLIFTQIHIRSKSPNCT